MNYKFLSIFIFLFVYSINGNSQEIYSSCQSAYQIVDAEDWCSGDSFFNNTQVSNSGYGAASCWVGENHDVWLKFVASSTAVNILLETNLANNGLVKPQIALYQGECGGVINELACKSDVNLQGSLNLFKAALNIGSTYYIRINGSNENQGTFSICVNSFNPPIEPGQDCITGSVLCDKSSFVVQAVSGSGNMPDEAQNTCLGPNGSKSESQSTWFKWRAATNGTFTTTITPLKESDDLDFAIFEIDDFNCANKEVLRCVATSCSGPTGLNLTSTDLEEDWNCDPGEDGFVKYIDMEANKNYALIINNFSETGIGFKVEFGGTVEFLGPKADFEVDPSSFECDQEITVTDKSFFPSGIGQLTTWNWNFGEGSVPNSSTVGGSHKITYESFGQKYVTLEIKSDMGCVVTKVLPYYVEKCCKDFNLDLNVLQLKSPDCPEQPQGIIEVEGTGGNPEYLYSLDNGALFSNGLFENLYKGSYKINVIDIKGCEDSTILEVLPATEFTIDAGEDQEVDLGFSADLKATLFPPGSNAEISWTPSDMASCADCLDPTVIPPGTTTYVISAKKNDECTIRDSVTVYVNDKRPLFTPNVFSPNGDGVNEMFTIFSGPAATELTLLQVYDRWGNLMYSGENIPIGDTNVGWNGRYKGNLVNSGVYVWVAKVAFVDNKILPYSGTITVVR